MKKVFWVFVFLMILHSVKSYSSSIQFFESDTCSVSIIQGDVILAIQDSQIPLSLSDTNAIFYKWSPSLGLSDTTIPNPILNVITDMNYKVEAYYLIDSNLVFNGDFELGNVGFQTDYTINTYPTFAYANYNIVTNASILNPGFVSCNNGGNYMAADGAITQNTYFYKQDVVVEPNTYYQFSVDCLNICATSTPIQNPILQFQINTQPIGSDLTLLYNNCNWYEFKEVWYSGANTIASIRMIDLNTIPGANDFAIDNITLKKICRAVDSIRVIVINDNVFEINLCENDFPYYFYDSVYNNPGYNYYFYSDSLGKLDTIFLNLISNPIYSDTIKASIYKGETYNSNGFNEKETGIYMNRYLSINNCDSLIYLDLEVISISFPNAVTANGDGINDVFEINNLLKYNDFHSNELLIFNRQGKKIYERKNISKFSDFWDPMQTNSPSGTYFYRFISKNNIKNIDRVGVIEVFK